MPKEGRSSPAEEVSHRTGGFMQDLKILQKTATLHEGRWWENTASGKIHCYLCPRHCHIGDGQSGFCFIRINRGGKLYNLGYASPAAIQMDPIEKKPLNHFLPGTTVFSMGTAGCNMGCFFCQNWDISKSKHDQVHSSYLPAEDVVLLAIRYGSPSIAFTYNEPTIWGEYVVDICAAAKEHGLNTVMVTNGYITYEAFHDIYDHIDAANVDLKAFTEDFYGKLTLTHLQPVLETLQWLKNETNVWFEITNLIIPTLNDDPKETRKLTEWIVNNLGPDVPLHFTAFHPDFKLRDKPNTPPSTLHQAREIAREVGLHYVYEGNIFSDGAHTLCPGCGMTLIRRSWHDVLVNRLKDGKCPQCGYAIAGRWVNPRRATPLKAYERAVAVANEKYGELNL
jgi:pyruvate formate lyase activating enzyme